MRLEKSNGCTGSVTTADNIDIADLSADEQKKLLLQLIDKAEISVTEIIDMLIECSPKSEYHCDSRVCEQCGNLSDDYTLTI